MLKKIKDWLARKHTPAQRLAVVLVTGLLGFIYFTLGTMVVISVQLRIASWALLLAIGLAVAVTGLTVRFYYTK